MVIRDSREIKSNIEGIRLFPSTPDGGIGEVEANHGKPGQKVETELKKGILSLRMCGFRPSCLV
jgi:hypothetical protein